MTRKTYRVIVSIEVWDADSEEEAMREVRESISDPTMIIEAISEVITLDHDSCPTSPFRWNGINH
jgi:hypothetical protein